MKIVLAVPTYWGRAKSEPFFKEDDVYDHPTPLDGESTLPHLLESLRVIEGYRFEVLVLVVSTHPSFQDEAEKKCKNLIKPFKEHFQISLFSYSSLDSLLKVIPSEFRSLFSLSGYSNVRNLCLLIPFLMGAEVIVFLDDDEEVRDKGFLRKALYKVGVPYEGEIVLAKAGFYIRPEWESHRIPETKNPFEAVWGSVKAMNKAFDLIDSTPRLKKTPFVFGGNMVVHKDIITQVCFDPRIIRGEDVDFLFNAKLFGINFFLDNELWVKHLPPPSHNPSWLAFRQNVLRFTYMRKKFESQEGKEGIKRVSLEELDPYPGAFLRGNLFEKIYRYSLLQAIEYLRKGDEMGYKESLENITLAKFPPFSEDPLAEYLDFRAKWRKLVKHLIVSEVKASDFMEKW
jgi:hypothetical protein